MSRAAGLVVVAYVAGPDPASATVLVRTALAGLGTEQPDAVARHHCPACGSVEHGRPWLTGVVDGPPMDVSVARCPGLTAVAVTDVGPVGIDVEPRGATRAADVDAVMGPGPDDPRTSSSGQVTGSPSPP